MEEQVFDTEHFRCTWPTDTDTAGCKLPRYRTWTERADAATVISFRGAKMATHWISGLHGNEHCFCRSVTVTVTAMTLPAGSKARKCKSTLDCAWLLTNEFMLLSDIFQTGWTSARTVTFSTFHLCFLQELALFKQLLDPVDPTSADDKRSKVSKKFIQQKFLLWLSMTYRCSVMWLDDSAVLGVVSVAVAVGVSLLCLS